MTAIDPSKKQFRDDWTAYVIAADQHDDNGDEVKARVLRRQGEMMRILVEAITPVCKDTLRKGRQLRWGNLPCGCRYDAIITRKQVTLGFVSPTGSVCFHLSRDIIAKPDRDDYLPTRVRELFTPALNALFAKE